jgi:hypothetical protein
MLDPHPANNFMTIEAARAMLKAAERGRKPSYSFANQMSFTSSIKLHPGKTAADRLLIYQDRTKDPAPQFPANVQAGDVYYQHTPANLVHDFPEYIMNLWGNLASIINKSSIGPIEYDWTSKDLSHGGVHDYYLDHVIPTLWKPGDPWLTYG